MTVKRKAPGVAPTTAGGDQQNPVPEATTDTRPTQAWRPWMGGPSGHFPGRKHYTLTSDELGFWLVEWPGGMATFAGFTRGEARQYALKRQQKTGRPILVEDSA